MARFGTSTRASKMIFQSPPWPPKALFCRFLFDHISGGREILACGFLRPFSFETGNPVLHFKENWNCRLLPELEP